MGLSLQTVAAACQPNELRTHAYGIKSTKPPAPEAKPALAAFQTVNRL
jgi:hypothetical protein